MIELPISGIKRIQEMVKHNPEYISFAIGSLELGGIPQQVKDYVQTLMPTIKTDYYDSNWGVLPFREKIVHVLAQRYGAHLPLNRVLATHGCMGALSLIYFSVLEPGDEVVIPEPYYPPYATLAKVARCTPVLVSMAAPAGSDRLWEMDIEKIKAAVTPRTKIIIFSNPSNPLGSVMPLSDIENLMYWCDQRGIYLVIDEAYRDYAFTPAYQTAFPLVSKSSHLIVTSTFSKMMAMSGWRVGFVVASEELTHAMASVQNTLFNCCNNIAQYAAMFSLDHPEFTEQFRVRIEKGLNTVFTELKPLFDAGIFCCEKPEGGFFVLLKTDQVDATDLCMSILKQAKVALVPGKSFGPSAASYLRLCFAREEDVLQEGLFRLKSFFM